MPGDDTTKQSLTPRSSAPQYWTASVAETKIYWYDLLVDGEPLPDFRDPIGRYLRRMQFALDGTMEKRLMYFLVSRPRVRIDVARGVSWGFFSLKLTVPVLIGKEQRKAAISLDLEMPFEATYKKPIVQLQDRFLVLNWGSMMETFSVHDLVQRYGTDLAFPSSVLYVGQTLDPDGKLAKGQNGAVNRVRFSQSEENDIFLLIQRHEMQVETTATDLSEEASPRTHMEMLEGALIGYFEGDAPPLRSELEQRNRREHLADLQATYFMERLTVDQGFQGADSFHELASTSVAPSRRHLFDCRFAQGRPVCTRLGEKDRPLPVLKD
jgi:hypothetical protein